MLIEAQKAGIRIIGPNCLGVMSPLSGMNATFATAVARPGSVGFISQSGALCTAVLDWSLKEMVGFSAFISVGSMVDVGWGDLIYYLGNDPKTKSIVIYMESIGNARSFLSAAREVALTDHHIKRTFRGGGQPRRHTGSLTGSDEVLEGLPPSGVRQQYRGSVLRPKCCQAAQPQEQAADHRDQRRRPGVLATDALIGGGGERTGPGNHGRL